MYFFNKTGIYFIFNEFFFRYGTKSHQIQRLIIQFFHIFSWNIVTVSVHYIIKKKYNILHASFKIYADISDKSAHAEEVKIETDGSVNIPADNFYFIFG